MARATGGERGAALLIVLWLLVVAGGVCSAGMAVAKVGHATTRNRLALARAGWARNGCAEILLARYARDSLTRGLDTVELGQGVWCRAWLEDPDGKLDINAADAGLLRQIIRNDTLLAALLDWRDPDTIPRLHGAESDWYRRAGRRAPRNGPLATLEELSYVRGFDAGVVGRLRPLLTTNGTGRLNLNVATATVTATVPGLGAEAVELLEARGRTGRPIRNADELLGLLSTSAREAYLRSYQATAATLGFASTSYVMHVQGGVRGSSPTSHGRIMVRVGDGRLSITRQEME